jgi:uncharacterized membrane protein YqjE
MDKHTLAALEHAVGLALVAAAFGIAALVALVVVVLVVS